MIVIPFQVSKTQYSVYVGFDDEGIDRMKAYDPGELTMNKLPPAFRALELKDVIVGYCSEADFTRVQQMMIEDGNPVRALRHLTRGFKFRPDAGDHDGPYLSAKFRETDKPN
jgi:hypothetical protein